jgi:hypothetical protein
MEAAAASLVEVRSTQFQGTLARDRPVRQEHVDGSGFAGCQADGGLAVRERPAVHLRHRKDTAAGIEAEAALAIQGEIIRAAGVGVLEKGVARDGRGVAGGDAHVQHGLLGWAHLRRCQAVVLGLLLLSKHVAVRVAVRNQKMRAAHAARSQGTGLQTGKRDQPVGDVVVHELAMQDRQDTVFQAASDVVRRAPPAAHQELVAVGLVGGFGKRDFLAVEARLHPIEALADGEDAHIARQAEPGLAGQAAGVRGGFGEGLLGFALDGFELGA